MTKPAGTATAAGDQEHFADHASPPILFSLSMSPWSKSGDGSPPTCHSPMGRNAFPMSRHSNRLRGRVPSRVRSVDHTHTAPRHSPHPPSPRTPTASVCRMYPGPGVRNRVKSRGQPLESDKGSGWILFAAPAQPGNSPVRRSSSNCNPSRTGTPSCSALASLASPGAVPTTNANVRLDTVPGDFPPRSVMAASASSRVYPSRVPVTTTDLPARVCSSTGCVATSPGVGLDHVDASGTQPFDHRSVHR